MSDRVRVNKDNFIDIARSIHGDKYDYSQAVYITTKKDIIIRCIYHNYTFRMVLSNHLYNKNGCKLCGNMKTAESQTLTVEEIIERAISKHGDTYDYSDTQRIGKNKMSIQCRIHGEFIQVISTHIITGSGCRPCGYISNQNLLRKDVDLFIDQANTIHNNKYDYTQVNYVSTNTKVCIICIIHGPFHQTPHNHLSGDTCMQCSIDERTIARTKTTEQFIIDVKLIHGELYDYSKTVYTKKYEKVIIICKTHGPFNQVANYHMNGNGCPKCCCLGFSKIACQWLDEVAEELCIFIQHALNIGEKRIGKYYVDGFCENTNTIYEFEGCTFHGCTKCYSRDQINRLNHKTMGELYDKTMAREIILLELGYVVTTIWECDYRRILKNRKSK